MARIATGGFQQETNTFPPVPAAGFLQEARALRHELLSLAWCSAQPSGRVTRDAFERISGLLLDALRGSDSPAMPAQQDLQRSCSR